MRSSYIYAKIVFRVLNKHPFVVQLLLNFHHITICICNELFDFLLASDWYDANCSIDVSLNIYPGYLVLPPKTARRLVVP